MSLLVIARELWWANYERLGIRLGRAVDQIVAVQESPYAPTPQGWRIKIRLSWLVHLIVRLRGNTFERIINGNAFQTQGRGVLQNVLKPMNERVSDFECLFFVKVASMLALGSRFSHTSIICEKTAYSPVKLMAGHSTCTFLPRGM
jgi:hypothetical protein